MANRPKKKQSSGVRNPDRRNGKAPKKNPKPQRTLTPEEKRDREITRIARADMARMEAEDAAARRKHFIDHKAHPQALAMHKIWLAEQKRAAASRAIQKMKPSI